MSRSALAVVLTAGLAGLAGSQGFTFEVPGSKSQALLAAPEVQAPAALAADLDRIFDDPLLAAALVGVRVVSLSDGRTIYARNASKLVMPASNMKLVTVAVAASKLGWDYRFDTTIEAVGTIQDGVLHGDLVVTGHGDPSIGSPDLKGAELFDGWANALAATGIKRVDGRLIGNDNAFADEPLGAGWAWDYLSAGYAAPSGALSYNENVAVLRVSPGTTPGVPAEVEIGPPGHGLEPSMAVSTTSQSSTLSLDIARLPGSAKLTVRGQVPVGTAPFVRTTTIDNPTKYFIEALRVALTSKGIEITGGAWDVDDLADSTPPGPRRLIARRTSEPLSSLAGYALKVSQNFYGEMFLKALGATTAVGTVELGRQAVTSTLGAWGLPASSLVMSDGLGLSRYNYVTADLLVGVLAHMWKDETLRGPYLAALPVGGHDGTLDNRMRTSELDRRVQAKTGTIANVRALSGYLTTRTGEKLAFSMIANNFTTPTARIDAIMEAALTRLVGN